VEKKKLKRRRRLAYQGVTAEVLLKFNKQGNFNV